MESYFTNRMVSLFNKGSPFPFLFTTIWGQGPVWGRGLIYPETTVQGGGPKSSHFHLDHPTTFKSTGSNGAQGRVETPNVGPVGVNRKNIE